MQFWGIAALAVLIALFLLWLALRLMFRGRWFLAWLKGSFILGCLLLVGLITGAAYDLSSYQQLPAMQQPLRLSMHEVSANRFELELAGETLTERVILEGDSWRISLRQFGWQGVAKLIGLQPGYRFDRLGSLFTGSQQQPVARFAQASLSPDGVGIDTWLLAFNQRQLLPLLEPVLLESDYYPLRDGAEYQIRLTEQGLEVLASQ